MADGRSCVFQAALESTEREGLERPRSPPHRIARAHREDTLERTRVRLESSRASTRKSYAVPDIPKQ